MKARVTRVLWGLTAVLVLLVLLKFFVADVYRVTSGSMRPTLFGGRARADAAEDSEHVLVRYDRTLEPRRFDLVVIRSPDGSQPLVKRVCGLPGDQDLMIRDGDLFVGRQRLPPDAPRPAPVLVYDDRYLEPERFFQHRRDGSVRREGDAWVVEGAGPSPGSLLHYHPALRDDYLDRRHQRVPGVVEVNDAVLELEFRLEAVGPTQRLHFQLVEEGDTFEVTLLADGEGRGRLRLVRRNPRTAGELILAEAPVVLPAGAWLDLAFSNVDNHLRVLSRALAVDLQKSYAENVPLQDEGLVPREEGAPWPARLPAGLKNLGPRVRFGVEAGVARFRAVRILRDLYYTDDGRFATQAPVSLGPDDYFLLGDNSAASTDSRHIGPVKAGQFLGEPVAVLWPEPRWLRPTAGP